MKYFVRISTGLHQSMTGSLKGKFVLLSKIKSSPWFDWLIVSLLLSEISSSISSFGMLCKINKLHSITNVCSSLIFIFLVIGSLDYQDYLV